MKSPEAVRREAMRQLCFGCRFPLVLVWMLRGCPCSFGQWYELQVQRVITANYGQQSGHG